MDIGSAIAKLRSERGLSQEELANMLFVSRDLVSKWESGVRRPDWSMIEKLAAIFDISSDSIIDKSEFVISELEKCLPDGCILSGEELVAVLNSFLDGLNVIERDMFIQRYYFLKSIKDIAIIFSYRENHVRSTLFRTRKKLRRFIERRKA